MKKNMTPLYIPKFCGLLVCATLLDININSCNAFNVVPPCQVSSSRLQSTAADYCFETEMTQITFTEAGHVSRLSGSAPGLETEEVRASEEDLEQQENDDEEDQSEEYDIEYLEENEMKLKVVTSPQGVLSFSGTLSSPAKEETEEEEEEEIEAPAETISGELSDSVEVDASVDEEELTTVADVTEEDIEASLEGEEILTTVADVTEEGIEANLEEISEETLTTVADVTEEDIEASLEEATSAFEEAVALDESDVVLDETSGQVAATEEEEEEEVDTIVENGIDDIEEPSQYDAMKDEELRLEMEALSLEVDKLKAEVESLEQEKLEEQSWYDNKMRSLEEHEEHAHRLRRYEQSIIREKIAEKEAQIEVLEKERRSLRSLGRAAVNLVRNRIKNILG